ncbi:MAG: protein-L-isoaspartate(D-aspartate) O-methyltransferase [Alphaproteobacteria bacterium]|nr:protein-L-isoaspartate(D-aspartate) O-methyltransferase [Alphaproteobacteria bacterium]
MSPDDPFTALRAEMVEIIARYAEVSGDTIGKVALAPRVMAAMNAVPRHAFVPAELRAYAYHDTPLPIGFDKTISQPFILALMTDLLEVEPGAKVLEVGTGLGYHAAVLSHLGAAVYSVELVPELAREAEPRLRAEGFSTIALRTGDGTAGWPDHAPFDRISVAAASDLIPSRLLMQLRPGGIMVVPTGLEDSQVLTVVRKDAQGRVRAQGIMPVRFATLMVSH